MFSGLLSLKNLKQKTYFFFCLANSKDSPFFSRGWFFAVWNCLRFCGWANEKTGSTTFRFSREISKKRKSRPLQRKSVNAFCSGTRVGGRSKNILLVAAFCSNLSSPQESQRNNLGGGKSKVCFKNFLRLWTSLRLLSKAFALVYNNSDHQNWFTDHFFRKESKPILWNAGVGERWKNHPEI